jgi:hypothetical protein
MGMMPLRINIFFHAFQPSVYSIFFNSDSITSFNTQEENDQAFSIAL